MYFLASKRWKHICPYCQSMFHLLERVISGINTITDSYYTENFPGPSLLLSDTVSIHKYLQMFKRDRNEMIQCHSTQLSLINSPKYIRYFNIRQKDKKSNSLPDPTKRTEKCFKSSNNTLPCFTSLLFQPIKTRSINQSFYIILAFDLKDYSGLH